MIYLSKVLIFNLLRSILSREMFYERGIAMKIIADLHTHTMVSQHAYSTLDELSLEAANKGFCAIATTDHGPGMPDGAIAHHFFCLSGLPAKINNIRLYKGAEVNIMDYEGTLDMEASLLKRLDFVISSYHTECITPASTSQHTKGLIKVLSNPHVDCLGHCGNPVFSINPEAVVDACASYRKLIEINSSSFRIRPGSNVTCRQIAKLCADKGVSIVVNSDAHSKWQVGEHSDAISMLEEIHFPAELIINADEKRLYRYFAENKT